jgi:serine/threonine-protein kinase
MGSNPPAQIGRYRMLCHLASGGMAEVWIAEGPNSRNEPLVCVKLMLAGLERDETFMRMFIEEARLAAPLCHPNLVQIDDLGMAEGRLYLAMEYIRGQALSVLSWSLQESGKSLEPELAASLVAQACRGLDYAHDYRDASGKALGLVHRDVSPHNLILRDDGRVKVVDFGIAKATSVSGTRTANLKGKIGYMAPEQIHGKGIDRRTDVFALGVTLWELSTGVKMFAGASDVEILSRILSVPFPDPREVAPDLPDELARITMRACARKPTGRYATAREMAEELEAFARIHLTASAGEALAILAEQTCPPMPRTPGDALERARMAPPPESGSLLASPSADPPAAVPARTRSQRQAPAIESDETGVVAAKAARPTAPARAPEPRDALRRAGRSCVGRGRAHPAGALGSPGRTAGADRRRRRAVARRLREDRPARRGRLPDAADQSLVQRVAGGAEARPHAALEGQAPGGRAHPAPAERARRQLRLSRRHRARGEPRARRRGAGRPAARPVRVERRGDTVAPA